MKRGDEMLDGFDEAIAQLERLRLEHYQELDVRKIVEQLGSRTERFFKSAVWPGAVATDTFDGLINRLKSVGVSKVVRSDLHAFRELYNDAKHDPNTPVRLKPATDVVVGARAAVQGLVAAGLGQTGAQVEAAVSRLLWVSGYDAFTRGVTEVYVSLPLLEEIWATHVDIVWIKGLEWDALKSELLATGSFFYGAAHFPQDVYARFNEGDFINAGVWDGDYRLLVRTLAKYEDRQTALEVLPNLRRDHMYVAVLSAVALAGIDVAASAAAPATMDELTAGILDRADKVYAMPSERSWVTSAAAGLAGLIVQVPFGTWPRLSGPYWNIWNPKELTAHIKSPDQKTAPYVIDDGNRVVIV